MKNGLITHFRIRMKASVASPASLLVLVLTAAAGLVYWPLPLYGVETKKDLVLSQLNLFWLFLWPAIACRAVGGNVAGVRRTLAFATRAIPALPVTPRARAVAEVLVFLLFALSFRLIAVAFGLDLTALSGASGGAAGQLAMSSGGAVGQDAMNFGGAVGLEAIAFLLLDNLAGAALMIPVMLSWAFPAKSINQQMARPFVIAVVIWSLGAVGLLSSALTCFVTGLGLSAVVLSLFGRWEGRVLELPGDWLRGESKARRSGPPEAQFWHDLWTRPLPAAGVLFLVELLLFAVDQLWSFWDEFFFVGTILVMSNFLSLVVLRPFGSRIAIGGVMGLPVQRVGDLGRAFALLPVRPVSVLRGAYLHGLISAAVLWLSILAVNLLGSWQHFGQWALLDRRGESVAWLLLPLAVLIPCIGALLVYATAGARTRARLAASSLILFPAIHLSFLVFELPTPIHVGVLVVLLVVLGHPPVGYLRGGRMPEPG